MANIITSRTVTRRAFLRTAGVALALPWLEGVGFGDDKSGASPKRRLVAICTGLGIHGPHFFPEKAGRDYEPSKYLKDFDALRNDFTVFSGLSHPDVDGGHSAEASFLTAAPHPGGSSFKNTISLDQFAVERLGSRTRFGYLSLATGGNGLSWTRGGVRIPANSRPSRVFAQLFLEGTPQEKREQVRKIRDGQSIMDAVRGQAKGLQSKLGTRDRQKLDEYFDSVRDLEGRLVQAEEWAKKPKPKVDYAPPRDINDRADIIGKARLMYDLMHLALETDSTRIISLFVNATNLVPPIEGVTADWHNLSHHGRDPEKIEQLAIIEREELLLFRGFLEKLKKTREEGESLLDRTMVLLGSNLGNASSHDTKNLPILLAGGGFAHGQHLAFDPKKNAPLPNLFVSMLQRLGLEVDSFSSGTSTLAGLVPKG